MKAGAQNLTTYMFRIYKYKNNKTQSEGRRSQVNQADWHQHEGARGQSLLLAKPVYHTGHY